MADLRQGLTSPWVEYDSRADGLTINFSEEPVPTPSKRIIAAYFDLDAFDNVVAIEVLGVSADYGVNDLIAGYLLEKQFREVEGALLSQFYRNCV